MDWNGAWTVPGGTALAPTGHNHHYAGPSVLCGGENGDPARTAWGRFSTTGFEADVNGVRMDGDVTSGFLGADISRDQWLGGLALSMSRGDGDFSLIEDDETEEVESTLTAVYPYTRFSLSERLDLWGLVGVGTGDVTLTEHSDGDRPNVHGRRGCRPPRSMKVGRRE